ncbi:MULTISPECIES: hypothetical protein [Paenibacillus]|uniref:DUF4352 domain-containing protein n=1 Tax=Paenibacillus lautus TaxID=1401 RepID=A0A1R1B8M6_PAELA|nr:hypothetical protein [Paenibacillus lautus]OME96402.1 hypothetical protein BK123_02100 [Paenibacillus lautus]
MNNKKYIYLISALLVLLLTSACGAPSGTESPATQTGTPVETDQGNAVDPETPAASQDGTDDSAESESDQEGTEAAKEPDKDQQILIVIDQTPKPITGSSFDFAVKQVPEGYSLSEMQWKSDTTEIKSTWQEAIEHGQTGEDGFYFSGNGQFSGFIYPDEMKGEEGQVMFRFIDEQGHELTWEKKLTLK